jgi:ABC-type branched-subunit amino acid transport system ATPase component
VLLSVEELERSFGGVRALDGAALQVVPGEVHGLIGPNGAGKTTLLNVISGLFHPTRGRIVLGGERIDGLPPHRIAARGITRTYQNIRLFSGLSALENVLVGAHLVRPGDTVRRMLFLPSARADEGRAREAALALLARVGLSDRAHHRVSGLSYGDQRRVEIARALASSPRLVLLDEPTAGMNAAEVQAVAAVIRQVAKEGQSVVLVEHNVQLVMQVCDRITVLNFGKVIAHGDPQHVASHPEVIAAYLGSEA